MKAQQKLVFDVIKESYYPTIREYHFLGTSHYFLEAESYTSEKYHLIANATNKYWELIEL